MRVKITWLPEMNSLGSELVTYVVTCEADCRDATARSVYQMVCMLGDIVTCGKCVGEPA